MIYQKTLRIISLDYRGEDYTLFIDRVKSRDKLVYSRNKVMLVTKSVNIFSIYCFDTIYFDI